MSEALDLINSTPSQISEAIITGLEDRLDEPLYPGDERRLFAEALVAVWIQMVCQTNDEAKQRLLRFARDEVLDALGENRQTPRLEAKKAETLLRFSLATAQNRTTMIPKGTRVTVDGTFYFETIELASIGPGELSVEVTAECTEGGAKYNGYVEGAIQTIVDMIPYVSSVTNLTATHGGDDGEPMDDVGNENYRERIRLSYAKLPTAGPEAAYMYHAMSASPLITDVKVVDDHEAGTVELIIVTGQEDPTDDIIEAVENICNSKTVRPLNDLVLIRRPERVEYDIEVKYYVVVDDEEEALTTIEGYGGAIDQFMTWQASRIGRDINPDKLRALCLSPSEGKGVLRLDVVKPTFVQLTGRQLAKFSGNLVVSHEVVEE